MQRYAFFDLDGTILPHDTQLLFANHVLKKAPWRLFYLALFVPLAPLSVVKLLRSRELKRVFLSYLFRMPEAELTSLALEFARTIVPKVTYPEVVSEIERHRKEGRTLVLNTASPAFYAQPIADELGFDHCIATRVETQDPMPLIPEIDGPNNKRQAKIPPMRSLLPEGFDIENPSPIPDSYAYTDSIVDLPLLACAEHAYVINPATDLATVARSKGWTVLTPPQPACCKAAHWADIARQMLGIWNP